MQLSNSKWIGKLIKSINESINVINIIQDVCIENGS